MFFEFWKNKKPGNLFSEFATKSISESIKIALTALATAATSSTPVGLIVGAGAKGMMDSLLAKSSQIDKKIDRILKEPLLSGINFLHQGITYKIIDEKSRESRDALLHDAHISLTKAWALVIDSIEDSLFIKSLDVIALAAHSSHWQTAESLSAKLNLDIEEHNIKVKALEDEAKEQMEYSKGVQRFLDTSSYRDKPHGYGEQKLFGKNIHKYSLKLEKKSLEAREKLDILMNLNSIANSFLLVNKS